MDIAIVFPHQLFEVHPAIENADEVYLLEDPYFFRRFKFHKQKLILHRASMKWYASTIKKKKVYYIEQREIQKTSSFLKSLDGTLHIVDPIEKDLRQALPPSTILYDSPLFINGREKAIADIQESNFNQTSFYIMQRKNYNILVENGKPKGGKWTYDTENRKKLPQNLRPPSSQKTKRNKFVNEAVTYIEKNFLENPGSTVFTYPVTRSDAVKWLHSFIKKKLQHFGTYEDAITVKSATVYHSVLTPMLNIGLLHPFEIIEKVERTNVPLNSKEGFIRQILGWREFMRATYEVYGETQRRKNFWKHQRKISSKWYTGQTGLLPVDHVIKSVLETAYAHHIERLMVLSNSMLLCEIHPHEVYRWFMELFIDAYDWVMVPNVYGMGQFADGGLITTKPYFSSSNYIRKMSDFPKGEWCQIWDALFWNFVRKHRTTLSKNVRLRMVVSLLDKMSSQKKLKYKQKGMNFLRKL